MAERDVRERDILVASNEYAYVQDLTKGDIVLYVGPTKISLSNTERLVELRNDRFAPVRGDDTAGGVLPFVHASSAQYLVLENPAKDAAARAVKGSNSAIELAVGRTRGGARAGQLSRSGPGRRREGDRRPRALRRPVPARARLRAGGGRPRAHRHASGSSRAPR